MNNKALKTACRVLVILVAVFTFNGLSFSLASADNGFRMLSFSSVNIGADYKWSLILVGIWCWLQFLFSLAAIGMSIISIFTKEQTTKIMNMIILIGGVIFCFLYMVMGVTETAVCNDLSKVGGYTTTAFIPFALNLVLMIAYFIISGLAKNMPDERK